jgi:hypothetical protein
MDKAVIQGLELVQQIDPLPVSLEGRLVEIQLAKCTPTVRDNVTDVEYDELSVILSEVVYVPDDLVKTSCDAALGATGYVRSVMRIPRR